MCPFAVTETGIPASMGMDPIYPCSLFDAPQAVEILWTFLVPALSGWPQNPARSNLPKAPPGAARKAIDRAGLTA